MEKLCVRCSTPFDYVPSKRGGRVRQYCTKVCYNADWHKNTENREAKNTRNKTHMNEWRKTHLKEARKRNADYRASHRKELVQKQVPYTVARRARLALAPINDFSSAQWKEMREMYNHCCAYCDQPFDRLEMEHITALSQGGSHTLWNIVPACRSCNASKNNKGPSVPVQPLLLTIAKAVSH